MLVLPDTALEVVGDTGIERSGFIHHDGNIVHFYHPAPRLRLTALDASA
jgi:hypothetical protein